MDLQSLKKEHCVIIDLANMFYLCRTKRINDASVNGGWPLIAEFLVKFNYWIKTHRPTSIIILDDGYPHWRYSKLTEYKSGRDEVRQSDPTFEDFRRQRKDLKEQIKKWFPVYFLRHEHLEADDLAFVTCKHLRDVGFKGEITAISNDADWLQIVTKVDNVKIWNPRTKLFTTSKEIDYDFVLYKSILGDNSDKIMGFKGVGKVWALKYTKDKTLFEGWHKDHLTDEERERLENNKFLIDFKSIPDEYIAEAITELQSLTLPRFDKTVLKIYCQMRKAWRFLGNFEEKCDNFLSLRTVTLAQPKEIIKENENVSEHS